MKKLLLAILVPCSILSMDQIKVNRHLVCAPKGLGKVGLSLDNDGFVVKHNGQRTRVNNYDLDKSLRGMDAKRLEAIQKAGAAIMVNKMSNGEFALRMNPNLQGGLVWGAHAGFWVGKFATNFVCHGTIITVSSIVGLVNPAAGLTLGTSLETTFAAPIEVLSNTIGLACGVGGAVATGPIG